MGLEGQDIEDFKLGLEEAQKEILRRQNKNLQNIAEGREHLNQQVFDEGEHAESNHRLEINISLGEDSSLLLKKIEAALKRIERGTYGRCIDCAREIHLKRLKAVPWEPQCLGCKNSEETDLKLGSRSGSKSKKIIDPWSSDDEEN